MGERSLDLIIDAEGVLVVGINRQPRDRKPFSCREGWKEVDSAGALPNS